MIVEFLELTFGRHDTCKLLCDTSLALARFSPTRRYTGLTDAWVKPARLCTILRARSSRNYTLTLLWWPADPSHTCSRSAVVPLKPHGLPQTLYPAVTSRRVCSIPPPNDHSTPSWSHRGVSLTHVRELPTPPGDHRVGAAGRAGGHQVWERGEEERVCGGRRNEPSETCVSSSDDHSIRLG